MIRESNARATLHPARVLVIGAGYAGLRTAMGLAQQPGVAVTVVDRERSPVVKTRLHELREATPTMEAGALLESLSVKFVQGDVTQIDREGKRVRLDGRSWLPYAYLVVATGSRTSHMGVAGVRDHAVMLDGAKGSRQLAKAVEGLEQGGGKLVVVGGGATGVEVAAEVSQRLRRGRVRLVEAGRQLLGTFPALPRLYAESALAWRGVRVSVGARVVEVAPDRLLLENGRAIPYDALLWSAGVEASPLIASACLAAPGERAAVDDFLVSTVDSSVYVVGDCASVGRTGPSAQLAVQQGDFAAADILRRVKGGERRPYEASVLGAFVSLGCDATGSVQLGPVQIPLFGPMAQAAKGAGEIRHRLVVAGKTIRGQIASIGQSVPEGYGTAARIQPAAPDR